MTHSSRRVISFEVRPPAGARRVDLFGEASDWRNPIAMQRREDGAFAVDVELGAGAYAYKFVIDGAWTLDGKNPRTRSSAGNRNSVVVVDGADEPLLFAPGAPFVGDRERGGLAIVAAIRKGAGADPVVRWAEHDGEPEADAPMRLVGEEDEHLVYAARVPASAARVRYRIDVAGAATSARAFVHERGVARGAPAWWRDALVYTVYVDRFRPERDRAGWEKSPGRGAVAGGHLEGIRRSLDEIAELGATVLYLTPVHVAASSHRYDFVDPLTVDPALGGEEAFARLVADSHARGMRVLMDVSFSHAGLAFPPCADVVARGRASAYAEWFLWKDGPDGPELRHYGRRRDAPLVNLEHPDVQALVLRAVDAWAQRGVDGLRLDMTAEVPLALSKAIRARFVAERPDGMVLGELVPEHAWRWIGEGAIDAATDFGFHGALTAWLALGKIDAAEAFARIAASDRARGGADDERMRFVSTHDHARFATLAHSSGRAANVPLGAVLLATMPGVPALLYGEEVGLRATRATLDPEDAWEDRAPMPWTAAARDARTRALFKELFAMRRASPALARGECEVLHADARLVVFRRAADGDVVDVIVNAGDEEARVEIADEERPAIAPWKTVGDASVDEGTQAVRIGPRSALVARRARGEDRARRVRLNVVARDRDMALARVETSAMPTRLDFAVTEVCNLRCEHCITFAPARTAGGSARTLTPWVLDRLRDALGYASYFGFVHGGESLAAPIFWDVLRAIREERAGAPYVAHLLTNGVLLKASTTERLVELGVSSISVSLDGATAETNDAIRPARDMTGRFERIVENLRDAARVRRNARADLRLGISFVVMARNVGELPRLVDLAADVGVDWIKLEEGVPVNAFAERSLVGLDGSRLARAVDDARARAETRGIVVVDHTRERTIWRCRLDHDADAAAFVRADEFANRSAIHPCRAPWEVACIEPNGDVRGGHFFGPILGNAALDDMRALWNGPRARDERARSHHARICGLTGPVTCV